jgi:hypothetical protein
MCVAGDPLACQTREYKSKKAQQQALNGGPVQGGDARLL